MDLVLRATLAEKAKRYDEMREFASRLAAEKGVLNQQERGLFSEAYRMSIGRRRTALRLLGQIEKQNEGYFYAQREVRTAMDQHRQAIESSCEQGLDLLGRLGANMNRDEDQAWLAKQKADFHRYLTEARFGRGSEQASRLYQEAEDLARRLPTTSVLRQSILLNHAVFVEEVGRDTERACSMLSSALAESAPSDSVVRAMMNRNLNTWRQHSAF